MEDFFPDYLRQYIQPIKLAEFKSKGKVVCSCGCDEFDYHYLHFRYVPTERDKQIAEINKLSSEMFDNRTGPYEKYKNKDRREIPFAGWTFITIGGIEYFVHKLDVIGHSLRIYNSIEELMKDPIYFGHVIWKSKEPNEPSEYQYIFAKCKHCGKEILLFDDRYYGYDGVCTHSEQPNKPYLDTGKLKMTKPHCDGVGYKIFVTIDSTGKEDLFEGMDGVISEENWKDAFEWIKIDLECAKCGKKKNVLNLETM